MPSGMAFDGRTQSVKNSDGFGPILRKPVKNSDTAPANPTGRWRYVGIRAAGRRSVRERLSHGQKDRKTRQAPAGEDHRPYYQTVKRPGSCFGPASNTPWFHASFPQLVSTPGRRAKNASSLIILDYP